MWRLKLIRKLSTNFQFSLFSFTYRFSGLILLKISNFSLRFDIIFGRSLFLFDWYLSLCFLFAFIFWFLFSFYIMRCFPLLLFLFPILDIWCFSTLRLLFSMLSFRCFPFFWIFFSILSFRVYSLLWLLFYILMF